MKKLISFLCALVLLICVSGVCYADFKAAAPENTQAASRLDAGGVPRLASNNVRSYAYSTRRTNSGASGLAKILAAMIMAAVVGGIKALSGKNNTPPANNAPNTNEDPNNQYYCKNCGKTCAKLTEYCTKCGAKGTIERKP